MSKDFTNEFTNSMLSKEIKECGHDCYPSSTLNCCSCSDLRPFLEGDMYPMYIDGEGWKNEASRNAFYCHICNPKNYLRWEKIICQEREMNLIKKLDYDNQNIQRQALLNEDRLRVSKVAAVNEIPFQYSNGDIYQGSMVDGLRRGYGTLNYFDGSTYVGNWVNDQKCGYGHMNWGDGIQYVGEWRDDMMNGYGTYTMSDGTIIEGNFMNDEKV